MTALSERTDRMARRGRARKTSERYHGGRTKPMTEAQREKEVLSVVVNQRKRYLPHLPHDKVRDPYAGDPLGLYQLSGWVTEQEAEAGRAFAGLWKAVQRDLDAPGHNPPAGALAGLQGGSSSMWRVSDEPPVQTERMNNHDELRAARAKRMARLDAIKSTLEQVRLHLIVERVAVHGWPIAPEDLPRLKQGLDLVARAMGSR